MRAGCSGSACAGCSGPRPPRPLWAAARRAGSASTSRWPGARWTWPGSGVLEALPLRSVRALLGTWAGSVARAGPPWTGQRACHPGRCGRCGAAAWPLPGHRLQPLPPAPAGTPWPLALRPGLPDGHPPWGCVQRPVDREAEEYLVPHVHSAGRVPSARAVEVPAPCSAAPAADALTFQMIWEMSHVVGRWSLCAGSSQSGRREHPLPWSSQLCRTWSGCRRRCYRHLVRSGRTGCSVCLHGPRYPCSVSVFLGAGGNGAPPGPACAALPGEAVAHWGRRHCPGAHPLQTLAPGLAPHLVVCHSQPWQSLLGLYPWPSWPCRPPSWPGGRPVRRPLSLPPSCAACPAAS